jgi:hypothetical protein
MLVYEALDHARGLDSAREPAPICCLKFAVSLASGAERYLRSENDVFAVEILRHGLALVR